METVTARPTGVPRSLDAAVVRVRTVGGEVVGAGFLVDAGHVMTCAHVVTRALGHPVDRVPAGTDTVVLDFPLLAPGGVLQARVEVWRPVGPDDRGDIAVLALLDDPPAGHAPARLVASGDFWSHQFRTFGFPRHHDQGVWAAGVLRAGQAAGWVQMEGLGPSGHAVEAGFSGSPVWDDDLAGVVGMTVAADAQRDLRTAYLLPADSLAQAWPTLAQHTVPPCLYRGLYPFRERDTGVFFGRENLAAQLLLEVTHGPLVALVGPSGSGKSSVVFAGLLPQILQQQGWCTISMRPSQTSSPLAALAAALLPALEPDQGETQRLTSLGQLTTLLRDGRLPDVIDRILDRVGAQQLLLVVDQFEELFARDPAEVTDFIRAVIPPRPEHLDPSSRPLIVVLTLRADFLGRALSDPALAAALQGAVTTIGQMHREQLRAVIEGPVHGEVTYEAGLVERILDDIGDEPGRLPLLEFALTLLWERHDRGRLTHGAYESIGGVDGALASYAERVYSEQLLPGEQENIQGLLIQLVRPSDVGEAVRRVARRPELGEQRWHLGQRLAATRLLVADRDPTGVESVELVHEALIQGWARLGAWVEADRAFRTWQERLRSSVSQWQDARQDPDALLRGMPLAEAERWLIERPGDLGNDERGYIRASQTSRGKSLRRLRASLIAAICMLLIASTLGVLALTWFKRADDQAILAESRYLLSQAQKLAGSRPDLALLLAAQAHRFDDTPEATETLTSMASTYRDVTALQPTDSSSISDLEFHPTNPNILALKDDQQVALWSVPDRTVVKAEPASGSGEVAFSRDGNPVAFTSGLERSRVNLWFSGENRVERLPDPSTSGFYLHNIEFSPDGRLLAACDSKNIHLWTTEPAGLLHSVPIPPSGSSCGFGFTSDSQRIIYPHGKDIRMWDIAENRIVSEALVPTPADLTSESTQEWRISEFQLSPDGHLAAYTTDSSFGTYWWDVDRQAPIQALETAQLDGAISFSPDGRWALLDSYDRAWLVDVAHRTPLQAFSFSTPSNARGKALRPDGAALVYGAGGGVIAFVETEGSHDIPVQAAHVAFPLEKDQLVSVSATGELAAWDRSTGEQIAVLSGIDPRAIEGDAESPVDALSPRAGFYARTDDDNTISLWDVAHPATLPYRLAGQGSAPEALSFDDNEQFLGSAYESHVILWRLDDHSVANKIPMPEGYSVGMLAVSPGGRYVATSSVDGHDILLWDTSAGKDVTYQLPVDKAESLAFSPKRNLLSIGQSGYFVLWDLERRVTLQPIEGTGDPVFNTRGTLMAALGDADFGRLHVWDLREYRLLGSIHGAEAGVAAFTPDSRQVATAGTSISMRPFDSTWAGRQVCRVVGRNMTSEEWSEYADGFEYEKTCP